MSAFRQTLRIVVWTVFGFVLLMRVGMSWWRVGPPGMGPGFRFEGPFQGQRGRMMRRGPTPVPQAVAKGEVQLPTNLWRFEIEIAARDVRKLQGYYWNGWDGGPATERPEVLVTVREGGVTYTNVALHPKGSAGSFRPFDDKPALTLNFSKNAKGQEFHGLTKLSLNNSVQDNSFLCEALSRELFVAAGVPAPRASHATVAINGRDLGLYVVTEGWGKRFLKQHFPDAGGNLYDGGFLRDVDQDPEPASGDREEDHSDLARLVEAVSEPDPAARWKALQAVLDVERFVTFMALEVMTCHWDGYCLNRNNYRVFHDRSTGRMVFMPHGMDQMFGVTRSSPTAPLYPSMRGLVARSVMGTSEGKRLYHERVGSLRTNVFVLERLTNRVHELARTIRPTLAAYSPSWAESHDREVDYLCERLAERVQSIGDQLTDPPQPFEFDAQGIARPRGWAPRFADAGSARFDRFEADGVPVLRIRPTRGGGNLSWRARADLGAGHYRFEGRARVTGETRGAGGLTLRISGQRRGWVRPADDSWVDLVFPIVVEEGFAEVELICEFAGDSGEAWFDEASLRLVKLSK